MKPVMYLFANTELGMSPGKLAAQVGHAAVLAYILSCDEKYKPTGLTATWLARGYTKLVMEARDTEHLVLIEKTLKDKGYAVAPIIDEGRTEIAPQSYTALGVQLVDKDDEQVAFDFADFKTLKPPKAPKKKSLVELSKQKLCLD